MPYFIDETIRSASPFILPGELSARLLAVDVSTADDPGGWYRGGYLQPIVTIDGTDYLGDVIPLALGEQLVSVPHRRYRLRYTRMPYFGITVIKIKQLTSSQAEDILMGIYAGSAPSTSSTPTVTTVSAAIVATALLAANANRFQGGFMVNNSNKNMWVAFGLPAVATAVPPNSKVAPNGGNIDIPEGYVGPISAIWENGATGSVAITEFVAG
jgi:hypothetical protein